jgi:hypothetical protein
MKITSKYDGRCRVCGKHIAAGTQIEWERGAGARHLNCSDEQRPPLNSPPPQQTLRPDTDIPALVRTHNRETAAGAQVRSISFMGREPMRVGTVLEVKGKSYMILSTSRPRYLSRDYLEDMDMFSRSPGYWYDAQCVEVQATAEEAAAKAKAAAEAEERRALEAALRASYSSGTIVNELPDACTEIWGEHRMAGSETWHVAEDGTVYRRESSYDGGPYYWRTSATRDQIERAKQLGIKAI